MLYEESLYFATCSIEEKAIPFLISSFVQFKSERT